VLVGVVTLVVVTLVVVICAAASLHRALLSNWHGAFFIETGLLSSEDRPTTHEAVASGGALGPGRGRRWVLTVRRP